MSGDSENNGGATSGTHWFNADVQFIALNPEARFFKKPSGPIHYLPVELKDAIVGYLWFRDEEKAAGFVARTDAGADGKNASVSWSNYLFEAKGNGLAPSEAVANLALYEGNITSGRVLEGSQLQRAASLDDLKGLASSTQEN